MTTLRRRRSERGASAVEAVIVIPVVTFLLLGMVDFGFTLNDYISVRQGLREGARQAVVTTTPQPVSGTWASNGCRTTGIPASGDGYDLVCLTKQRVGLDESNLRVSIVFSPQALPLAPYSAGAPVVLCAQYKTGSISGVLGPILNGKILTSIIDMRIEQDSTTFTAPVQETPFTSWPSACFSP